MASKYNKTVERNFLLGISILFVLLTLFIIKDLFTILISSLILSYFLYPIYKYFLEKIGSERISSLLTLLTSTILFFIPLALLSYFLIINLIKIVVQYKEYIENPDILNAVINNFLGEITTSSTLSSINFAEYINAGVSFVVEISKNFFSSIPKMIVYFFIMIFISYYILMYNKKILRAVNDYIPLSLRRQNVIMNNISKNLRVLFRGYFLTGIIQTFVALIGYIMFGAPNILIITFLTLLASLIPYLGTPLVWVPVSIYMIVMGNKLGIFLLLYGTLVISLVDNFVRPYLMSDKDTIHPSLVFIGFIGGMLVFGIIGIILGPIIISITAILLKYLQESYGNPENF